MLSPCRLPFELRRKEEREEKRKEKEERGRRESGGWAGRKAGKLS